MLLQSDQKSTFALATDPGQFDVSLRPPDGLPWIVTPGFQVNTGPNSLPTWSLPLPLQWSGHLRIPTKGSSDDLSLADLPRALLRVYVLLDDSGNPVPDAKGGTAIAQIAETRCDADGSFSLVIPDQIQPQ
jgi:hypothetical protein